MDEREDRSKARPGAAAVHVQGHVANQRVRASPVRRGRGEVGEAVDRAGCGEVHGNMLDADLCIAARAARRR